MSALLQVSNLKKSFSKETGLFKKTVKEFKAVNGVSFQINKGETLGLVGESGCGKSTTGRMIVDLVKPTSGSIVFEGKDIGEYKKTKESTLYLKSSIQMIFQDSYASLDPRMTAGETVTEAVDVHGMFKDKREKREYIEKVFQDAGLSKEHIDRYPHQFSGGQRQRIGIARALSLNPKIIVCDEPVSALDVSVQAQIINNMKGIQEEYGISYLFISHDLGVVKHISHRVIVMYLGFILEEADKHELFSNPVHPYTKALLAAAPSTDPDVDKGNKPALQNEIDPSLVDICCPFANRCSCVMDVCRQKMPPEVEVAPGHRVMCHLK